MQSNKLARFQTEGNQDGWFPAGFCKTYCLSPSFWGNEREHHQHTLLRKAEKKGKRGRGQAVSTSVRTENRVCCTAAVMNSAAH